jgi:hypothetical protein
VVGACDISGERIMLKEFWCRNLKERYCLEDLGANEGIISNCILNK